MNKRNLIAKTSEVLRANEIKKHVASQKSILHISDDNGNHSDFIVKRNDTDLQYTMEDVTVILDTFIAIAEDALKRGDEISIQGFGTLGLKRRASRSTFHPVTGEPVEVAARYVPRFAPGVILKNAAAVYSVIAEQKLKEADEIVADKLTSDDDQEDDDIGCD